MIADDKQNKKKKYALRIEEVCGHSNVTFVMFYMVLYLYPIWKGDQIIGNILTKTVYIPFFKERK